MNKNVKACSKCGELKKITINVCLEYCSCDCHNPKPINTEWERIRKYCFRKYGNGDSRFRALKPLITQLLKQKGLSYYVN